jgi:hypothetical protein
MNKLLTHFTYTHSNRSSLHQPHVDRIKKYFPSMKSSLLLACDVATGIKGVKNYKYVDGDPFYVQMGGALSKVTTPYLLYVQEDYILFDQVDELKIEEYLELMERDESIGFIRLLRSGIENSTVPYSEELSIINPRDTSYYSTQATIWRRDLLKKLLQEARPGSLRSGINNGRVLGELGVIGLCTELRGSQRGGHYDSVIYPYTATAIVGGEWNTAEYPAEIEELFDEYPDIKPQ